MWCRCTTGSRSWEYHSPGETEEGELGHDSARLSRPENHGSMMGQKEGVESCLLTEATCNVGRVGHEEIQMGAAVAVNMVQ